VKKLMVMAGGTGGHIYPAMAVARMWQDEGGEVVWLGTPEGMESTLVPQAGFKLETVPVQGIRGKGVKALVVAPLRLLKAIWLAYRIISRQQPDVVLGMGGFVAGPGGVASWLMRKPLVIHEQNAIAGLTNRWLSRLATAALEAFPSTFPATVAARTVGNPVRQELFEIEPAQPHQPLRLLVLGGSLGAQRLNELMPIVAKELVTAGKLEIVHQSGARNLQATLEGYQQQGVAVDASQGVRVVPYLQQIDEVYRWADLVLCRSGAMTVSELAMVGRPSILIPFPFAVDDHQTANGAFLQQQGAAEMVQQRELSSDQLIQRVNQFIEQPDRIEQMGRAAKAAAEPEATRQVKEICKMLCRE